MKILNDASEDFDVPSYCYSVYSISAVSVEQLPRPVCDDIASSADLARDIPLGHGYIDVSRPTLSITLLLNPFQLFALILLGGIICRILTQTS